MTAAKRLTASDIRRGMSSRWTAPEWAIMWEVGNSTGLAGNRYADAVMMSLWPSRGLELHGVEIKVSRSDWRNEAADPTKAESIARFCDRWWIHTPPGVVSDLSELPPAWGLREFDGRSWRTLREAEKTDAEPVSRGFLAALLRRADGTMRSLVRDAMAEGQERLDREAEKRREQWRRELDDAVKRRTEHIAIASENIAKFEAVLGDKAASTWADFGRIGAAARALADLPHWQVPKLAADLRDVADKIEAMSTLSAPTVEGDPK